jgi:hypothetical protein
VSRDGIVVCLAPLWFGKTASSGMSSGTLGA